MIVRYEKVYSGPVNSAWKKIIKRKSRTLLETRLHLINMINYVSNTASQSSDEYHKKFSKNNIKKGNCHFMINTPVPPFADLFLSLLYKNGLDFWLRAKFRNTGVDSFAAQARRENGNGKWVVKIGSLTSNRSIIIPIKKNLDFIFEREYEKNMDVDEEYDNKYLHIIGNGRIRLVENEGLVKLSITEWNAHQLASGNNMMDLVANMDFILGKKQQEILNVLERYLDEKDAIINEKEAIIKEKDEMLKEKEKMLSVYIKN